MSGNSAACSSSLNERLTLRSSIAVAGRPLTSRFGSFPMDRPRGRKECDETISLDAGSPGGRVTLATVGQKWKARYEGKTRRRVMKRTIAPTTLVIAFATVFVLGILPSLRTRAQADERRECSNASLQGSFGFTSTGTLLALPAPLAGPFGEIGRQSF